MSGKKMMFDASKRVFDVVVSVVAFVLLLPLMMVIAVLIALRLGRPILFRQERPGKDGQSFELVKFRSMRNVSERRGIVTDEQRMTRFGSLLRSLSVDELPSLWNVARGDMSLVGPRPLLVRYLPLYSAEQARRHEVRPGLTGLAQISGRNSLAWARRFELDVHYVDNRSWRLDVHILLQTVRKVIRREGIQSEGLVVGAPFLGATEAGGQSDE